MVDHQFADIELAQLYDCFCPWSDRDDLEFYLPRVLAAGAVLDVGCGTGMLLHHARDNGHSGRLCGIDPAPGMLAVARTRTDLEWFDGTLAAAGFSGEFDLIVMTGHAFQVLLTDDELRAFFTAAHAALAPGGRLAFETRNPLVRTWQRWTPEYAVEATAPDGARVRMAHQVQPPEGDLVTFSTTYSSPQWSTERVNWSTLRFLDVAAVNAQLAAGGFVVAEQYGDWDSAPYTAESPEIITIAACD